MTSEGDLSWAGQGRAGSYDVLVSSPAEMLNACPIGLCLCDHTGRIVRCNATAELIWRRCPSLEPPEYYHGAHCLRHLDGMPIPRNESPLAHTIKTGRPVHNVELLMERADGTSITALVNTAPLLNERGELGGAVNSFVEISPSCETESTWKNGADESVFEVGSVALHVQRLAAIVDFSDDAIISKDVNGIIQTWNKGAERIFGYSSEEVVGRSINLLIPADRQGEEPAILDRIRRGERIEHYETARLRKDRTLVTISLTVSPLKDTRGRIVGASKIARDVTEQRRNEERRQLMVNELNHRVKNALATVQSLATQSLRGLAKSAEFRGFEERLVSLGRAHDLLTRQEWNGVEFGDLVRQTLFPMCTGPLERFHLSGPVLKLCPRAALSLSRAFHELSSNAIKYGALASQNGHVNIAWALDAPGGRQLLRILWQESGGPKVRTPKRRGFGSLLLTRVLTEELDATVEVSYLAAGLTCEIAAPASSVLVLE